MIEWLKFFIFCRTIELQYYLPKLFPSVDYVGKYYIFYKDGSRTMHPKGLDAEWEIDKWEEEVHHAEVIERD